jgi:hypothetical protein
MRRRAFATWAAFAGCLGVSLIGLSPAKSQNNTVAGAVHSPYPTLHNISLEWNISGDDNLNGVVSVLYRKKGEHSWREGMPLRRVPAGQNVNFQWQNKHAGSVFDLNPDTAYEIRLRLADPDGGDQEKMIEVRTRPEPTTTTTAKIIDIAPGVYNTLVTENGTASHPVVYRCKQGIAIFRHIDLTNRRWVLIEGLVVDNIGDRGIGIKMNGASDCVVRRCVINAVYGIVAYKPGAANCYISDNVITGTSQWTNKAMGAQGDNIGEGIEMTGPGNVICYNRVSGFRDCISTMEESHAVQQTSIDIYNNDIYRGVDDGIEADFCFVNCRIFRNRLTNCYVGLSSQPGLGGPNYFVRNVMYNVIHAAFKLKRFSQGDVVLHNTVVKVGTGLGGNSAMDHAYFRNNLAFGGPTGGINWGDYGAGNPYAADIIAPGAHSSFDYDAVGVVGVSYEAQIGERRFSEVERNGLEELRFADTFVEADFPDPPLPERNPADLRLKRNAKVIDAGLHIPNINDDYSGKAPDCGAYEFGQDLPHYGPRPHQ